MAINPTSAAPRALPDFSIDPEQVGRPPRPATPAAGASKLWGEDGFTFGDFLDLINPLQHIPIVSTVYRAITGDTIDPGARLIGGSLFGGAIGFAAAAANVAIEEATGKDIGGNLVAMLSPGIAPAHDAPAAAAPAVAAMQPQPAGSETPPAAATPVPLTPAPRLMGTLMAPAVDRSAAAQHRLFAVPLPTQLSAQAAREVVDPAVIGAVGDDEPRRTLAGVRAEDLSAQELVRILLRYQAAGRDAATHEAGAGETATLGDAHAPFPALELKE